VANQRQFEAAPPNAHRSGLRRRSMSATLNEPPVQAPRRTPADVPAAAHAAGPSFPVTPAAHSEPSDQAADAARRRRVILGYVVALGSVGLAIAIKLLLSQVMEAGSPFLFFFGAVMVAAWYGGLGPGLLATVLADLASNFFFMEPRFTLDFTREQGTQLALFLVEGICISFLSGTLHAARRRAETAAAVARELEHTLAEVSEAEQQRIGRDLHDGLGQQLTGIALLSKALEQRLTVGGRPEAADAGELAELANESIDWTRDLARGLAPVDVDRTALPAALRELAVKTERMCRIRCSFDGDERLILADDGMALNLYRVAQEAVNNAVRHAQAKHIWITLATSHGRTTLTVRDDGVGLSGAVPEPRAGGDGAPAGGMGLRIMRYRTSVVGASFQLGSTPGQGTTITCTFSTATNPATAAGGPKPPANGARRAPAQAQASPPQQQQQPTTPTRVTTTAPH
jgi:signal transduction histidine kinase